MAITPSTMIPLGTLAPDFELVDTVTDKTFGLQDLKSEVALVVMFICNHCPFVKHIQSKLVEIAKEYQRKNIQFVAISSNDIDAYPEDAPEKMKEFAIKSNFTFPYLYDPTQKTARAYAAACTPDFYIFDHQLKCVYRGRLDDSTPNNDKPVSGKELSAALDCILESRPVSSEQMPSVGCNIKWKD